MQVQSRVGTDRVSNQVSSINQIVGVRMSGEKKKDPIDEYKIGEALLTVY